MVVESTRKATRQELIKRIEILERENQELRKRLDRANKVQQIYDLDAINHSTVSFD